MSRILWVLAFAGCGRFSFDPLSDARATDDSTNDTGAVGGPTGLALEVDGTSYAIADSLCAEVTNGFTASAWVLPATDQMEPDSTCILAINNNTGGSNFSLLMWDWINSAISYTDDFYTSRDEMLPFAAAEQWHYVSMVVDAAGNGLVYSDGVLATTVTTPRTINAPCRVSFGQEWDGMNASDHFVGLIDEIAFWRVVRSQSQIVGDMGTNLAGDEANLAALYRFDQGDARDDSMHGHDATLQAGAGLVPIP